MNNYKIKVNNEAESKEAQDLFEQLGFTWAGDHPENGDWYSHLYAEKSSCCHLPIYVWNGLGDKFQELTLPQLRDLVVLHRNDVRDATHENSFIQGLYKGDSWYVFHDDKWNYIGKELGYEPIKLNQDKPEQSLISGADALRALADGDYVEYWCEDLEQWVFMDMQNHFKRKFRLKPSTITLNVEIPACGTSYKNGQLIWILNSLELNEYCSVILDESDELPAYWWSTEEEIKQVVEALRGGIKG